jgi:hypothetical protein
MTLPNIRADNQAYARRMMQRGPYFDLRTGTLRIPHRWRNEKAKREWVRREMRFDDKRREYYRAIPPRCQFEQIAKARRVFFSIYARELPAEYFEDTQKL